MNKNEEWQELFPEEGFSSKNSKNRETSAAEGEGFYPGNEVVDQFDPAFNENPSTALCNEAIMASAGTGKTFSLAMRYMNLLHAGVAPGRILASTFTKKAAGEIYDKIAEELINLARSDEKIKALAQNFPWMKDEKFCAKRAGKILGRLLNTKDRLQISTLDSFFVNIIRAFPMECGIYGELSIMDEHDVRGRVEALLELLREIPQSERKAIMEVVKEASFGESSKLLYGTVKELIFNLYDIFLICPEKRFWCSDEMHNSVPAAYYSSKDQLEKCAKNYSELVKDFFASYKPGRNIQRLEEYFTILCSDALKIEDTLKCDAKTVAIWEKLMAENPNFIFEEKSPLSFTYHSKTYTLQGEFSRSTLLFLRHILYCSIHTLVKRNEALWHLLDLFNKKYALLVRGTGRIAFSDIPYLLRPSENASETGLALPFSDRAGIEERLDEKNDHFLIDEFQDTSDSQWSAISRLAEEAIVDSDARRSFFYVGDIKQSIYQWRNGNPGLFDMILNKFPESIYGSRGVRKNTLTESYRSCNEVLDMVNAVFMNPGALSNIKNADIAERELLFSAVNKMQYEKHFASASAAKQKGYSCYIELPSIPVGGTKSAQEIKFRKVYDLLMELDPFQEKCSFSVGVLFRANHTAAEFAECIRRFNMEDLAAGKKTVLPVSVDSKISVKESLFCVIAYYILLGTAHPGDPFVRKIFEMLELGEDKIDQKIVAEKMGYPVKELSGEEALYNGVRSDLANGGFELFFQRFTGAFFNQMTSFDQRRLKSLADAARSYDLQNLDDIDAFLELAFQEAGNEISLRNTVQCMTYHKSKGLAFDIVIMPDINGKGMASVKLHEGVFLKKDPVDFSPRFLTAFPDDHYWKSVPFLREFAEDIRYARAYESCCTLYVGMTRAKHALYLFGNEAGSSAKTINMATMCSNIFASINKSPRIVSPEEICLWEKGDPLWYQEERKLFEEKEQKKASIKKDSADELVERNKKLTKMCLDKFMDTLEKASQGACLIHFPSTGEYVNTLKPSDHSEKGKEKYLQTKKFALSSTAAELGTKVHELFSRIDFYDGSCPQEYLEKIFGKELEETEEGKLFRKVWEHTAIRDALKHPGSPSASLWKEKAFLLPDAASNTYINGIFDRLAAKYDENGQCCGATVLDYKSDRLEEENAFLERYSSQLNTYRKAAASLLKIQEKDVECLILALRSGKVIKVPMAQ